MKLFLLIFVTNFQLIFLFSNKICVAYILNINFVSLNSKLKINFYGFLDLCALRVLVIDCVHFLQLD
jgi:hypothetical protein